MHQKFGARRVVRLRRLLLTTTASPPPAFLTSLAAAAAAARDPPVDTLLALDGGPPRFSCPLPPANVPRPRPAQLPLLFFLTGLDGSGLAAWRSFAGLTADFDVRLLTVPVDDRTPFDGLVDVVVAQIEREVVAVTQTSTDPDALPPPRRPIYLAGESFGCVLAIAAAARAPGAVDRLVLVNPATSFARSPWAAIAPALASPALVPDALYPALPLVLAPILGNPVAIAAGRVTRGAPLPTAAAEFAAGVAGLPAQLGALTACLPRATLEWRVGLVKEGAAQVQPLLRRVRARTLVVAGAADALLPSADEAKRLERVMPRCKSVVLPGRTHAMLQEGGDDLATIVRDAAFYTRVRTTSAPPPPRSLAGGGPADPVDLFTQGELDAWTEKATATLRRLTSPVFVSTASDGRAVLGLSGLPDSSPSTPGARPRPILFVGNHQLMAFDMSPMIEQIYRDRGMLVRGLAHPAIFTSMRDQEEKDKEQESKDANSSRPRLPPLPPLPFPRRTPTERRANSFEAMLTEWGAVPVGPRNFKTLLANGESVLLFPGGAREAVKLKGEDYQLFWPEKGEFVRMAAKHGAIIVPFAAIGCEDSLTQVLDAQELVSLPVVGPWIAARARATTPPARRGVSANAALESPLLLPLAVPSGLPERMYYKFGAGIELEPELAQDRDAADAVYRHVKSEVEAGIAWLMDARTRDPYRKGAPRLAYEAVAGGAAPTFEV